MQISKYLLPILVVVALWGGYTLRGAFTKPTTIVSFTSAGTATLKCTVEGLKCKGTANYFTSMYKGKAGIGSIETFASEHLAVFSYDPNVISANDIVAIMEAPVPMRDGSQVQVFKCLSRN